MKKNYLSYEEAKKSLKCLDLRSSFEYRDLIDSGELDNSLFPRSPWNYYGRLGDWISWKDYLGYEIYSSRRIVSIEEAKKFAREHNITTGQQWMKYDLPPEYPKDPRAKYKDDFKSWGEFLGTGSMSPSEMSKLFLDYQGAKKLVQKLGIKSSSEYFKLSRSKKLPKELPGNPQQMYEKTDEWKSWGEFLGTSSLCPSDKSRQFLSFEEARNFARSLNFTSIIEWNNFASYSGKRPDNIPGTPYKTYSNSWISWSDWLGHNNIEDNSKSKGELHIENLLKENNFSITPQKRFNWLGLQSLDVYIPDLEIAIEIQGKQHFSSCDFFGGEERFKSTIERDERKYRLCQEHKVILLYYVFDDRIQIPQEFLDKHEYIRDDKSLLNKLKEHGQ